MLGYQNLQKYPAIEVKHSRPCCSARTSGEHTIFFVQAFETLYRFFFSLYLKSLSESESFSSQQSLQTTEEKLREDLSVLIHEFSMMTSNNDLDSFRQRAQSMLSDSATGCSYKGFTKFMLGQGSR